MEYAILYASNFLDLRDRVNSYIRRGWEPLGGVCANGKGAFFQAMIKKEDKDE